MMTSSLKVESFEPFGKGFCSQHPFAARESQDDSSSKQDCKSDDSVRLRSSRV